MNKPNGLPASNRHAHSTFHFLIFCFAMAGLPFGQIAAQGFFKTYPSTAPASPRGLKTVAGGGFLIEAGESFNYNYEKLLHFNAAGDLQSTTTVPFATDGMLRLNSGNFLKSQLDAPNNEVDFTLFSPAGASLNTFSMTYPAGKTANYGSTGEYADGSVFVTLYYGDPYMGGGPAPTKRTVVYAKVNPLNGLVAWQQSFLSNGNVAVAAPRLVKTAADGSAFVALVEDQPGNQSHFVFKVSPTGQLLWNGAVSTLERYPIQFAPTPDGGVWFFFNQVYQYVQRLDANGASVAAPITDSALMGGSTRSAIVATPDNGVIVAGNVSITGQPQEQMYTIRFSATGAVVQTNVLSNLPQPFPRPSRGLRLPSGEYVFAGTVDPTPSPSPTFTDHYSFLIKLNENGAYLLPPPATCTGNLLTNPGFENGLANWSQFGSATVANSGNSGTKSVQLCPVQGGDNRVLQGIGISPNTGYTFQFYGKVTSPANAGNFFGYVKYLNSSFQPIPFSQADVIVSGGNWALYQLSSTAPANAAYLEVGFDGPLNACALFDDACVTLSGSGSCTLSASVSSVLCNDNGTSTNPGDDRFSGTIIVASNGSCGSGWTGGGNSGPYSSGGTFGFFPISGGDATVTFTDSQTPAFTTSVTVPAPPTCSPGGPPASTIAATATAPQCNDNGTPSNPADDTFTFSFTVNGAAGTWQAVYLNPDPGSNPVSINGQNGTPHTLTFPIAAVNLYLGGNMHFTVFDVLTPNCSTLFSVAAPATCSSGGGTGQIDLSLALLQTPAAPAQWSNYPVKATISNAGPQAATGVKVKFAKPAGVVYTGGNEFVASQGTFAPFGNEEWNVGSIPANGSATLTVSYFLLQATAPVAYAQVTAHAETDGDSQPNNGTPPTPVQDDEASTSGEGGGTQQPDLTLADLQIPTTSVAAGAVLSYNFDASNTGTAAVPGNFTIKSYISTDNTLSANDVQDGTITTGNYGVGLVVNNVAGASTIPASLAAGSYFLIVKMDADGAVTESNENNNVVVRAFTVTGIGGSCKYTLSFNGTNCQDPMTPNNPGDDLFSFQFWVFDVPFPPSGEPWIISSNIPSVAYSGNGQAFTEPNGFLISSAPPGGVTVTLTELNQSGCVHTILFQPPAPCSNSSTPNCNAITITPGTGSITIAGASAPHVLMKVFRPNWTVAFECLDGTCGNPQLVTGLNGGNHFVEIKLFNAAWGLICTKTQTVNVIGGSSNLLIPDDRFRLSLDKFYPNPASHWLNVVLFSPKEQPVTLDFYNQQGRRVHTLEVQLEEGRNTLELPVSDWKSGTYNVIARGEGLPAYGRFMKVWEE